MTSLNSNFCDAGGAVGAAVTGDAFTPEIEAGSVSGSNPPSSINGAEFTGAGFAPGVAGFSSSGGNSGWERAGLAISRSPKLKSMPSNRKSEGKSADGEGLAGVGAWGRATGAAGAGAGAASRLIGAVGGSASGKRAGLGSGVGDAPLPLLKASCSDPRSKSMSLSNSLIGFGIAGAVGWGVASSAAGLGAAAGSGSATVRLVRG